MSRNITLKYEIPKENIGAPHYGFIYKFNAISKLPNNPRIHDREETTTNAGIIWQLQDLMPYMSYTLTVYAASHQGLSFPKTQTIETAPEGKMFAYQLYLKTNVLMYLCNVSCIFIRVLIQTFYSLLLRPATIKIKT